MIPPVEVRKVRPCWTDTDVCVCFHDDHIDCHLDDTPGNSRHGNPEKHPCIYNLYVSEYREIIDSGEIL